LISEGDGKQAVCFECNFRGGSVPIGVIMAVASKNARTSNSTQKFSCSCGGEIKMKTLFENGKIKNIAECEKCKRSERRPSDFK
jgi:hypothetical protein